MTPTEKLKTAKWLREQVKKLKDNGFYPRLKEQIENLEAAALRLEKEAVSAIKPETKELRL